MKRYVTSTTPMAPMASSDLKVATTTSWKAGIRERGRTRRMTRKPRNPRTTGASLSKAPMSASTSMAVKATSTASKVRKGFLKYSTVPRALTRRTSSTKKSAEKTQWRTSSVVGCGAVVWGGGGERVSRRLGREAEHASGWI